jgi:hypothetical protein
VIGIQALEQSNMIDVQEGREQTCQWCGGTIPEGGTTCLRCGAVRPREDVVVPGLNEHEDQPEPFIQDEAPTTEVLEEPDPAASFLAELSAEPVEEAPKATTRRSDPTEDALVIVGLLFIAATLGGVVGWFLAPPLLHDLFEGTIGVESDGPEAFRRLGAFIGALVSMLFGATLATVVRR